VVALAEADALVDVGRAALVVGRDVVELAAVRGDPAARKTTTSIAGLEVAALLGGSLIRLSCGRLHVRVVKAETSAGDQLRELVGVQVTDPGQGREADGAVGVDVADEVHENAHFRGEPIEQGVELPVPDRACAGKPWAGRRPRPAASAPRSDDRDRPQHHDRSCGHQS